MYEIEGALLGLPFQAGPVCLAAPAPAGRPLGPDTRFWFRFPGSFRVPGVSPGAVPVSDVRAFLLPSRTRAQASEGSNLYFFRYPQNDAGYPHMSGVIHCLAHNISTARRL
jgi:hypothetical protein